MDSSDNDDNDVDMDLPVSSVKSVAELKKFALARLHDKHLLASVHIPDKNSLQQLTFLFNTAVTFVAY